ncbi:MAG TPA: glycerol-3-phosphate 1-O-acyltransferase PlsY [Roseiflexaceae bacterium]|nr:glycerol-3-phosphate 1-O-acyltransferase PlsY [Roseiflexaceae bacterium]
MSASQLLWTIALMALAYLIGSIPFSYLVARANGVDLRKVGSGNVGAANVWRNCGFGPFLLATAGDILKGMLPTLLALHLSDLGHMLGLRLERLPPGAVIAIGIAAILGHTFSLFLNFKGGKAVATSTGVLLAIFPLLIPIGLIAWVVSFLITRMSSVGSLTAAGVEMIAGTVLYVLGYLPLAYAIFIWVMVVFIVYLHRTNIQRLIAGTENRFSRTL